MREFREFYERFEPATYEEETRTAQVSSSPNLHS